MLTPARCTFVNTWFTSSAAETDSVEGVPLSVLHIDDANVARVYEKKLLLVRPDHHVSWRGDSMPADALALIRQAAGQADS